MVRGIGVVLLICLAALPVAAGGASVGGHGFDASGMEPAVKPGEDFNAYANGNWARRTVIPADHANWGTSDVLKDRTRLQVRAILEEASHSHAPAGSNLRKIGDYYASYMDTAAIERRGAAPLRPQLAAIAAIRDYRGLAIAMGQALRVGDSMPVTLGVIPDLKRPELNLGYLEQGGLGLPDRDYYLLNEPSMAAARTAYLTYVSTLLRLCGLAGARTAAAQRAQAVFDLEHRLAAIQWTRVQLLDLPARYVPWTQADYALRAPGFAWSEYFEAAGIADQPILVASTESAITATASLVQKVPLEVWRDYLAIRAIDQHAPYLSKAFVAAHFAFHDTALSGTPNQQQRWKRGAEFTEQALGEAIGQIYVQRHFSPQAKAAAKQLVSNLLAAAARRIDALDWMSAGTKARAQQKIASFLPKIGYPDKWRDYSTLTVRAGDAYGNALAAERFEYQRNLAKLGRPVDRSEWDMTPVTINAYYDPTENQIVFPAAVLQPPFFDPGADLAVNYGSIGAIIGHEISHGFDDRGRQFDASGALADWWTPEDAEKYRQRSEAMVAQYAGYEVLPGLPLNGRLTLSENIADNAGLVLAYDAYHAALGDKPAALIDGLSGDQRFFLSFAQTWRRVWREPSLRQMVTTDPHSPDALRVRAVRNCDPWYPTFGVRPGDAQYLAPELRVRIW